MVIKLQSLTEAGVTTPLSLPVDTNGRDIKNAKCIKNSAYKIMKNAALAVSGVISTRGSYLSNVLSYKNG